jgi:hypothetical protein
LRSLIEKTANQFLKATQKAKALYNHIVAAKGGTDDFVTEVSMDETDDPQVPAEMLKGLGDTPSLFSSRSKRVNEGSEGQTRNERRPGIPITRIQKS